MATKTVVVPAVQADVPRLARVLSTAFARDPVSDWLFDGRQDRHHPAFFTAFLYLGLACGRVEQTVDGQSVAVWIDHRIPLPAATVAEFDHRLHAAVGEHAPRWRELDAAMRTAHPHEPHWSLTFLGTAPAAQGNGHAGALLGHAADWRAGTPAYLEATSRRLTHFYTGHGYRPHGAITVPGGPALHPMWHPG
jgi:GNAT superfamily N-acetyltransferase